MAKEKKVEKKQGLNFLNWKKWQIWLITIFILSFILFVISEIKKEKVIEEIEYIPVLKLREEYDLSEIVADEKYKEKSIGVFGIVDSIDIKGELIGNPFLVLRGEEYSLFGVQCMFESENRVEFENLIIGQSIKVIGKIFEGSTGNIILYECRLVEK